jgi:hypothetical protein
MLREQVSAELDLAGRQADATSVAAQQRVSDLAADPVADVVTAVRLAAAEATTTAMLWL